MYTLMVSYNCGTTYCPERWVEDIGELDARCDELDAQGLRWAIEDENGKPVYRACAIHAGITAFMERANLNLALDEIQARLADIEARLAELKTEEEME